MKKIINGKKYDTETATLIGDWWNRLGSNDFGYCVERLYKKKTGEFFLNGEGGANTKYATKYGNMYGSGETIEPLTVDEAKAWAERHLDADTYESVFGECEE
jgi:hypothetical protein